MENLQVPADYPDELVRFLHLCHPGGQQRSTPLLLRYREGDYNALHQDVYGRIVFPLQVICCLSRPEAEFTGGELLLVEQLPRAQSIGRVVRLVQGEAVVITTRYRPARGNRGFYRTNYRDGVSPVESGERFTLGIISLMRNKAVPPAVDGVVSAFLSVSPGSTASALLNTGTVP